MRLGWLALDSDIVYVLVPHHTPCRTLIKQQKTMVGLPLAWLQSNADA
jgi:hypothetical protein